jgi:hypothetical protein
MRRNVKRPSVKRPSPAGLTIVGGCVALTVGAGLASAVAGLIVAGVCAIVLGVANLEPRTPRR